MFWSGKFDTEPRSGTLHYADSNSTGQLAGLIAWFLQLEIERVYRLSLVSTASLAKIIAGFLLAAQHLAQLLRSSRSFVSCGRHGAVHRRAAGVPDSDISPGIVLLWHFKSRRTLGWIFPIYRRRSHKQKSRMIFVLCHNNVN